MLPVNLTLSQQTSSGGKFVAVCSPNAGDTFALGISFDFGDIGADQCYGEEWHRDFVQVVFDPYWKATGQPCSGITWAMDSAPCAGDGNYSYPPLVEPLLAPPAGTPPEQPAEFYTATTAAMPDAVGTAFCESIPRDRAAIHALLVAWLTCDDWKDFANFNC